MTYSTSVHTTKYVHEVFDLVEKESSRAKKIELLQKHKNDVLLSVLKGTFDDVIQWNLPGGKVPFTPADPSSIPSTLSRQLHLLPMFVKGQQKGNNLNPLKRERMFIDMMESIHPRDAEVIEKMINKQQPAKGVTKKLVQEAFPNLITK